MGSRLWFYVAGLLFHAAYLALGLLGGLILHWPLGLHLAEPAWHLQFILGPGMLLLALGALLGLRTDRDLPGTRWRHVLLLALSLLGLGLTQVTPWHLAPLGLLPFWILMLLDAYLTARRHGLFPRAGVLLSAVCVVSYGVLGLEVADVYVVTPGTANALHRDLLVEGGLPKSEIYGLTTFGRFDAPRALLWASRFSDKTTVWRLSGQEFAAYDARTIYMMQNASATASALAQQLAGIGQGIEPRPDGMMVTEVQPGSPADGHLHPGDILRQVDGVAVASSPAFAAIMATTRPGQEVTLGLERGGETLSVEAMLQAHPVRPQHGFLGIVLETLYHFDSPRQVTFLDESVSGPSMGAALFLAVLDQLHGEPVTHGNRIAVTGTIEPDGAIGTVGSVPFKGWTAEILKVDALFVPTGQGEEARSMAPAVNVVEVSHYREILEWCKANSKL